MADYIVREEDGTSHLLLEDSSGALLLQGQSPPVTPAGIAATSVMTGAVVRLRPVTPAAVSATSTVTGRVAGPAQVSGASVSATSAVTGRVGAGRPVTPAAVTASSTVAGRITGHVVVAPAAIHANSSLTGSLSGTKFLVPTSAVTATSATAGHIRGHVVLAPAAIHATSIITPIFGPFVDAAGVGPGNGGETFPVTLAPNGAPVTATLVGSITDTATLLELTGDAGLPADGAYVLQINDEVLYVAPIGSHLYRIRRRGLSNTAAAIHVTGAAVTWGDSYDMAIVVGDTIADSFTADIDGSGSTLYRGGLVCFDATQAYLSGSRYAICVSELLGVFDAGAGSTGANRVADAQASAISTPAGVTDDCPSGLTTPSRIDHTINVGDVALVRYTNPEASILELGPRSASCIAIFGLKWVDNSDVDVSATDPDANVVDGVINGTWLNPLGTGINPDTGAPVANVHSTSVTMPGSTRNFTRTTERGWPVCVLTVRHGNRRVPFWRSWDWRDYGYVDTGFGTDTLFAQLLINRNDIVFGSVPSVALPGTQDIDGPDAVWDDGSYYFAASWYVLIYGAPYFVVGPTIGGTSGVAGGGSAGVAPVVTFTPGGGSPTPTVTVPPTVEGGDGGDIPAPTARKQRSYATIA